MVLVEQLPPESSTKAAMQDSIDPAELAKMARSGGSWSGYGPWSREALMLAEVVDRLGDVVYTIIRANGGKRPPADPYPRPGVVPKRRARRTDPKAVAYLDQIRKRKQQQTEQ